jgi:3-hydroxymyristoyl/3-hydroxydecanoyl-(acyl carrier protein) dehydratase
MRWRFLDRASGFELWKKVDGKKAISLEEYCLLERFGRRGDFPEILILECCVELVRWLVTKSSNSEQTCILAQVDGFRVLGTAGAGDVLEMSAAVLNADRELLQTRCTVQLNGKRLAEGILIFLLLPLSDYDDHEMVENTWKELYGSS